MGKSSVREWHVKRALESMAALLEVWDELTLNEALYCLNLESKTQRRKSIIASLIRRAVKMNKAEYYNHLKETYDGKSQIEERSGT